MPTQRSTAKAGPPNPPRLVWPLVRMPPGHPWHLMRPSSVLQRRRRGGCGRGRGTSATGHCLRRPFRIDRLALLCISMNRLSGGVNEASAWRSLVLFANGSGGLSLTPAQVLDLFLRWVTAAGGTQDSQTVRRLGSERLAAGAGSMGTRTPPSLRKWARPMFSRGGGATRSSTGPRRKWFVVYARYWEVECWPNANPYMNQR